MNIDQILKVLKNERECIKRQVDMTKCKRHEHEGCLKCDLCLPDTEILEVYDFLINGYELLQNEGAESYTIKCKEPLSKEQIAVILGESTMLRCTNCGGELDKYNYCKECGYKLYDVTTSEDIMRQYKSMPPIEEGDTE